MIEVAQDIIENLKNGGVGILPTDTIYGLVGSALSKKAVERIYKLKKRNPKKPFIILIADVDDLKKFGVALGKPAKKILGEFWPGSVSVILRCPKLKRELSYLKPFNKTLAFRCPKARWLNDLLKTAGPLVAPSANPEGAPPAETIKQAKKYFTCPVGSPAGDSFRGGKVDFYVDVGKIKGLPSTLISLEKGKIMVLREGKIKIKI